MSSRKTPDSLKDKFIGSNSRGNGEVEPQCSKVIMMFVFKIMKKKLESLPLKGQ